MCKHSSATKTMARFLTVCCPAEDIWYPFTQVGGSMAVYLSSSCRTAVTGEALLCPPHSWCKSCVWSLANGLWVQAGVGVRAEEWCAGEEVLDSHLVAYIWSLIQSLIRVGYEFQKRDLSKQEDTRWLKGSDDDWDFPVVSRTPLMVIFFEYLHTRSLLWKGPFVISGVLLPNTTCIWKN